jgi:6-phosphogluconolactonase
MKIIESNKNELEDIAVKKIIELSSKTISSKGDFIMVLPGGDSVKGILEKLNTANLQWDKIHIFLTDERNVTKEDSHSNFNLIQKKLENSVKENLHFIDTSKTKDEAIREYNKEFEKYGGVADLVILSSGSDGHVASLFPNDESIKNKSLGYIMVNNSPKPPKERFSLSKETLKKTKNAFLIFFGSEKYDAFQDFNNPLLDEESCPAQIVQDIKESYILVDVIK